MENNKENYEYCKYLNLEDALKERKDCFDENRKIINSDKLSCLMENPNFVNYIFSEENLITNARQDEDLSLKASGEFFQESLFLHIGIGRCQTIIIQDYIPNVLLLKIPLVFLKQASVRNF